MTQEIEFLEDFPKKKKSFKFKYWIAHIYLLLGFITLLILNYNYILDLQFLIFFVVFIFISLINLKYKAIGFLAVSIYLIIKSVNYLSVSYVYMGVEAINYIPLIVMLIHWAANYLLARYVYKKYFKKDISTNKIEDSFFFKKYKTKSESELKKITSENGYSDEAVKVASTLLKDLTIPSNN